MLSECGQEKERKTQFHSAGDEQHVDAAENAHLRHIVIEVHIESGVQAVGIPVAGHQASHICTKERVKDGTWNLQNQYIHNNRDNGDFPFPGKGVAPQRSERFARLSDNNVLFY